jgi:sulfate adenylyltransferase
MPEKHPQAPHGGTLVNLMANDARVTELKKQSTTWPSLDLTQRQICDLELLMNGGFSPLKTFMNRKDYESACKDMRLTDGTLWPMPICLDVDDDLAKKLSPGDHLALRDPEGVMLAVLTVKEQYKPDLKKEAQLVFGTTDELHPGVEYLMHKTKPNYISGTLEGIQPPSHYDFKELRQSPAEVRAAFVNRGWTKIVAFQTRNPMHRAHVEITTRAAKEAQANLLIQPVVGMTKPGDIDHFTRVRIYKALLPKFPPATTMLSLLPLAMRMGGPREALWHAIIRKNYGMTHFIVGRDHAGPGKNAQGKDFYGPYDSQSLVDKYAEELNMQIMPGRTMVFVPSQDKYMRSEEVPEGVEVANISGTELRERLRDGRPLPEWFTYPEVAEELRRTHKPRNSQGLCIFFTGLSGAGKSTIANALAIKLLESGGRQVTLLDGDVTRKALASELGFSKQDRDTNILRIGFVAAEIAKHGGIAICAPIAPYKRTRKLVKTAVKEAGGGFLLAYVSTPLAICEGRDRKGLYQKAREGVIKEFTGISDPYETPKHPDLTLDTESYSADELAQQIILHLEQEGYIGTEH